MTILEPGTFRVSDFRKDIPEKVKRKVLGRYNIDHRPPLQDRAYDTEAGDFIPPQHDPNSLFIETKAKHDELTFGRKDGAEKTVTTAGSDANRRKKTRDIRDREAVHQDRMAAKVGQEPQPRPDQRPQFPGETYFNKPKPPSRWAKGRKIQSRGFQQRQQR